MAHKGSMRPLGLLAVCPVVSVMVLVYYSSVAYGSTEQVITRAVEDIKPPSLTGPRLMPAGTASAAFGFQVSRAPGQCPSGGCQAAAASPGLVQLRALVDTGEPDVSIITFLGQV